MPCCGASKLLTFNRFNKFLVVFRFCFRSKKLTKPYYASNNKIDNSSTRANDIKADPEVLPSKEAVIINLKDARHIDMCDQGSETIKKEIIESITKFINNQL